MLVLGVHGGDRREDELDLTGFAGHDSAAVLLRDGEVIAAIEEERLDRIKHSNCFPRKAISYCLNSAGLRLADIDRIALNISLTAADVAAKGRMIEDARSSLPADGRAFISSLFHREFGISVEEKLHFCHHHVAHAWSAFVPSGFQQSLIISIDGDGDNASGMVLVGREHQVNKIHEFSLDQSLGHLYENVIKVLGYSRFDEYKVMGLAPYGNPQRYLPLLKTCYELLPNGNYWLAGPVAWFACMEREQLVSRARRRAEPFSQEHKDLAAALQAVLENIVLHVLKHFQKSTGQRNLCLAGGVAHNCTLNGKILYSNLFDKMFVQPAAHDAGGALGAAWNAYYEARPRERFAGMKHLYFGGGLGGPESIEKSLTRWEDFLTFDAVSDIASESARLLANGSVIGWMQGRSEFGPRALGNRSILADPRPGENKLRINAMVKKREQFRPFAPSVLAEELETFFDVASERGDFSYMIFVLKARESARALLAATTHVDGTARVQSVSHDDNPIYWKLIHEFGKLTGVPVLLNTSFNNNAEPIVDSIEDAIVCFLTTGLNYLVIDNYVIAKKSSKITLQALGELAPDLVTSRRLAKRRTAERRVVYEIATVKSSLFGVPAYDISREAFSILESSDGTIRLRTLMRRTGVADGLNAERVLNEIFDLWAARMLTLSPVPGKSTASTHLPVSSDLMQPELVAQ